MSDLLPHPIQHADMPKFNAVWDTVLPLFEQFGAVMFRKTYMGYLIIVVVLVNAARLIWRWVKGLM
ncbi:MAG: hypothetical protein Q8N51_17650 [Gammaproteobacteria bacterium]|nr:hypothetical protein [Gammaproteobacteria bacterium]